MKMQFDHQTVELPKIKQKNNALPDGGRAYQTPEGKLYPSITTVLSIRNKIFPCCPNETFEINVINIKKRFVFLYAI